MKLKKTQKKSYLMPQNKDKLLLSENRGVESEQQQKVRRVEINSHLN